VCGLVPATCSTYRIVAREKNFETKYAVIRILSDTIRQASSAQNY